MLTVVDVASKDLPANATKGFKILGDEGDVLMFFHWTGEGELPDMKVPAGFDKDGKELFNIVPGASTASYADVLAALPDRLEQHDIDPEDIPHIMGEIVGRYGAGE